MTGQECVAGFPKAKRLLTAADYGRVFDNPDAKASHKHLLFLARTNTGPRHRIGLVIAKKHIRQATQRNRVKRAAREFFRQLPQESPTLDVVLLARQGMGELDNAQLSSILQQQWLKLVRHASKNETSTCQDT